MKKYIFIALAFMACTNPKSDAIEETVDSTPPSEWIQNATIYEVNVRQYTPEGTFAAFEKHLDKLNELGVDILWFMPIQPIGKLNRKAVGDTFVQDLDNPDYDKYWGSPYSISDYTATNPRYGTVEDFKRIVEKCHEMDIKVILDWVGNHTSWDNNWIKNNPEWYTHDSTGEITDPIGEDGISWGWTDVADLNYENEEMRAEMINSMKFWVEEYDLDGFRCDVAMEVPTDFWNQARTALEKVKPLFMLAESETHKPDQFDSAFDAYYAWEMLHVYQKMYDQEVDANEVIRVVNEKDSVNGTDAFPMNFITNHDENSWNGTVDERLKESWRVMAVLSYALRGMPLIYSGQEAGLNHRLSFFAKDSIDWNAENAENADEYFSFYKKLNELKENASLAINSDYDVNEDLSKANVLVIDRGENSQIRFVLNLSSEPLVANDYKQGYSLNDQYNLDAEKNELGAWGYLVLNKQ